VEQAWSCSLTEEVEMRQDKQYLRIQLKIISLLIFLLYLFAFSGCRGGRPITPYPLRQSKIPIKVNPYIVQVKTEKGELVYYGSFHTVNPANPQFNDIEQKWQTLNPTIALCEGNIWPSTNNKINAIRRYGEQGLLSFLAARDKVRMACLEPPATMTLCHLLKYFSVEQIKMYYILRQAAVQRILRRNVEKTGYVKRILSNLSRHMIFKTILATKQEFEKRVRDIFPEIRDWRFVPFSYFDIEIHDTWLSRLHLAVNHYRDRHMIKKISRELNRGGRIFALVGKNHVIKQAPILKRLFKTQDAARQPQSE
jgi:hypothetical protein